MDGSDGRGRDEAGRKSGRRDPQVLPKRIVFILAALLCIASAAVASVALAQGTPGQEELQPSLLTPQLIEEADQAHTADQASPEVDTEAAVGVGLVLTIGSHAAC